MSLNCRVFWSRSLIHLVALVCACWGASSAFAQADRILIVNGDKVPETLSEGVSDALGEVGSVMSAASYGAKLRGSEAPDSEQSLTRVAPQMGAALIVVLQPARSRVKVELRSGYTGEVVGKSAVPGRGKRPKLAKPARKKLIAAAKRALKKIGPAPAPKQPQQSSSSDDDFADVAAAPQRPAAPARQPSRPVQRVEPLESEQEEDEESSEEEEEAPPRDDEPAGAAKSDGMLVRLHAGLGLGTRSIVVPVQPMSGLANRIDTSYVPALDIGASLELPLGPAWVLRFGADYRTIFGLTAGYFSMPNVMATSSLSSHSLIAGGSLGHLSDGRDSFGVHVFLGWGYRSLSAAEPTLPSAGMQGVVLRPELEIPFLDRKLALRLAPELILILVPSATLQMHNTAVAGAVGYALGAELSLDLHLSKTFGLSLFFRESRGSTPDGWGTSAIENERYIALRVLVQF